MVCPSKVTSWHGDVSRKKNNPKQNSTYVFIRCACYFVDIHFLVYSSSEESFAGQVLSSDPSIQQRSYSGDIASLFICYLEMRIIVQLQG